MAPNLQLQVEKLGGRKDTPFLLFVQGKMMGKSWEHDGLWTEKNYLWRL
jgi:hypothetical protein